jgi:hypothetical protein
VWHGKLRVPRGRHQQRKKKESKTDQRWPPLTRRSPPRKKDRSEVATSDSEVATEKERQIRGGKLRVIGELQLGGCHRERKKDRSDQRLPRVATFKIRSSPLKKRQSPRFGTRNQRGVTINVEEAISKIPSSPLKRRHHQCRRGNLRDLELATERKERKEVISEIRSSPPIKRGNLQDSELATERK